MADIVTSSRQGSKLFITYDTLWQPRQDGYDSAAGDGGDATAEEADVDQATAPVPFYGSRKHCVFLQQQPSPATATADLTVQLWIYG